MGNPKAVRALRFALKYVPPTIILEYEVVPSKSRRHLTLTIAKLTPKKDPYAAQPPLPCPDGTALLAPAAFCHPQSAMLSNCLMRCFSFVLKILPALTTQPCLSVMLVSSKKSRVECFSVWGQGEGGAIAVEEAAAAGQLRWRTAPGDTSLL